MQQNTLNIFPDFKHIQSLGHETDDLGTDASYAEAKLAIS